jgi:drug/metabolite transporter (DMT)-like permease
LPKKSANSWREGLINQSHRKTVRRCQTLFNAGGLPYVQPGAKTVGVLAVLGASIMWAIEPVVARLSYENADVLQTSAVRAMVIVPLAALYVFVLGKRDFRMRRSQVPAAVYVAVVGTLCADLLYYVALSTVPVLNAVLIAHLQPLFVVLFAFFLIREERLTVYDYLGIFCMMIAAFFVTTRTVERLAALDIGTTGDALVLVATVMWATTAIAVKKYLSGVHAGTITFYRFLVASIFFAGYALATDTCVFVNYYQIAVGVVIGVGTLLYYEALRRIKVAQVAALELSAPFFAALLGYLAFDEAVTGLQAGGMALLFIGVFFLAQRERWSL